MRGGRGCTSLQWYFLPVVAIRSPRPWPCFNCTHGTVHSFPYPTPTPSPHPRGTLSTRIRRPLPPLLSGAACLSFFLFFIIVGGRLASSPLRSTSKHVSSVLSIMHIIMKSPPTFPHERVGECVCFVCAIGNVFLVCSLPDPFSHRRLLRSSIHVPPSSISPTIDPPPAPKLVKTHCACHFSLSRCGSSSSTSFVMFP